MAKYLPITKVGVLIKGIIGRLLNKFDYIIAIEGGTGQSKSTLAIHIARGIRKEFAKLYGLNQEKIKYYYDTIMKIQGYSMEEFIKLLQEWKEKNYYKFNMYEDLIYSHEAMKKGLTSWHRIIIPDEAILLSHNRDFQGSEQKIIIKMINVYRDHGNVVIMCIPNFNVLDIQLKSMCRMRISVPRRGIGIVQTPNKTFYGRDKWESALNEKIEKEYLMKNPDKPAFVRLTTARFIVTYKKLSPEIEARYQEIKNEKRGKFEEDTGVIETNIKKDKLQEFVEILINGGIKNSTALEGYAYSLGMTKEQLRRKASARLEKMRKPSAISSYYTDKKEKLEIVEPLSF